MAIFVNGKNVSDDDDYDGDVAGVVISGNNGPVHVGKGHIITHTVIVSGDSKTVAESTSKRPARKKSS
jgi:hypothetical protein